MEENQKFIPEGWAKQKGENLFKVQGGYAFKSNDYKDEGILLVRISNVGNNNFIYKDLIYVSKRFLRSHSNFLLNKDDVLMGLTGDLGKICILENGEFPFILNQRVGRFIFNEKVNNRFLYYLISSSTIQNKFEAFFTGGAQKNISPKQIESVEYSVPKSTNEQQSIARILTKTDQAIANTEALIAKYNRIKTGLMQDLLTRGIDENGNIRSEQTHEFKDSPLGKIPNEWELKPLGRIANFNSGYAFKYGELTEDGYKVVRISNLHKPEFPYWHYKGPIKDTWVAKDGDILFTWAGVATSIDCIEYKGETILLNQHIYNFIFENDTIKYFTYKYLQSFLPKLRLEIEGGAGQLHLTKDKIQAIQIPIMSVGEMKKISKKFKQIDSLLDNHQIGLSKLQLLKTGLMQDLLSGKVRVNEMRIN